MPARIITTARQERLGAELRKLREQAELTIREAARLLGIDQTKISHTEAGRVGVSEERVRLLTTQYACGDKELVEALVAMAGEREHGWWEEFRGLLPAGFLDLAEMEHYARYLRTIEISHIPGLMQTENQVRAIVSYSLPELSEAELEARVAHRLRRRVILDRASPPKFDAVVHEAALRIRVGDRKVARDQLLHLAGESERPHVSIRVVPFDVDGFAGIGYPMLYVGGPVPQLDTVLLDSVHGSAFLHAESQVRRYRNLFSKVGKSALDERRSRDFMLRLAREM
ncbi:helix-turn-helix transcriptional regulator [Streptomyces sp. NPDC003077]|uniref:helix-turn-helix domain-containing protein n=1 Tax=Streptomyces sp. NPDC003077 TaxID=3154443 RepID=UPI0033B702B1